MFIISVAIFRKGLREDLSFWSSKEINIGNLVSVPIRGKYCTGIVLNIEPAIMQKANIKNAPFELRKITSTKGPSCYSEEFIKEIRNFAKEYAVSVSDIFGDAVGDDGISTISSYEAENLSKKSFTYIHEPRQKRLLMYKRFVREALSNKKLIIICTPTKSLGLKIYENISNGIEKHIVTGLESGDKSSKLFKQVCSSGKSICLIANPKNTLALLPFADVLIMDECSSRFYTNRKKPHIPYNELITRISKNLNLKTILAGSYLNSNQMLLVKEKELEPNPESNTRFLIDNSKIEFIKRDKENWEIFPSESKKIFENFSEKRIFILSPKSGLFPVTICGDCKKTLTCKICSAPMRLFEKKDKAREYICPRCSHKHSANITCANCKSWNLKPFGIGQDRIYEILGSEFKDANIYCLSDDLTTTNSKKILKNWSEDGGIIIGTEKNLNKLESHADFVILVSIDSLFGIPNYRISERILETILNASDFSIQKTYVITNLDDEYLFNEIKRGSLKMFYSDESADRQDLGFPPFGYLLNIRKECKINEAIHVKKLLKEIDTNIETSIYKTNEKTVKVIGSGLYDKKTWFEKIAPLVPKLTDQTFEIFVNETDWL